MRLRNLALAAAPIALLTLKPAQAELTQPNTNDERKIITCLDRRAKTLGSIMASGIDVLGKDRVPFIIIRAFYTDGIKVHAYIDMERQMISISGGYKVGPDKSYLSTSSYHRVDGGWIDVDGKPLQTLAFGGFDQVAGSNIPVDEPTRAVTRKATQMLGACARR